MVSLDSSSDTILREYNSNTDRPNTLTEAADSKYKIPIYKYFVKVNISEHLYKVEHFIG